MNMKESNQLWLALSEIYRRKKEHEETLASGMITDRKRLKDIEERSEALETASSWILKILGEDYFDGVIKDINGKEISQ